MGQIKVVLADGSAYAELECLSRDATVNFTHTHTHTHTHTQIVTFAALFDYEREANTCGAAIAVHIPTY
jgi:hypothetical protein